MLKITGNTKSRAIQKQLRTWDFQHVQNKNSDYWMREDESQWRKIRRWSSTHHLEFQRIDKRYVRSSSYRQTFLAQNKGLHHQGKVYRCAYCGKKVKVKEMEVDHLISCKAAESNLSSRLALKVLGAQSVNDPKNLVPACLDCNRTKGADQGLWVWRGLVGRYPAFWVLPKILGLVFILVGLVFLYLQWASL